MSEKIVHSSAIAGAAKISMGARPVGASLRKGIGWMRASGRRVRGLLKHTWPLQHCTAHARPGILTAVVAKSHRP